jgi:hypothetical protein
VDAANANLSAIGQAIGGQTTRNQFYTQHATAFVNASKQTSIDLQNDMITAYGISAAVAGLAVFFRRRRRLWRLAHGDDRRARDEDRRRHGRDRRVAARSRADHRPAVEALEAAGRLPTAHRPLERAGIGAWNDEPARLLRQARPLVAYSFPPIDLVLCTPADVVEA